MSLHYLPPPPALDRPALTERQIRRMAFRVQLFQRHGWDEDRAERWADHLHDRDMDRDDRRLCVECRNLLANFRCAQRGTVLVDTLQRCPSFSWEVPEK